MCDFGATAIASAVIGVVSSVVSGVTAATNAQQQADAQAESNRIAAEQAAAQATAENIQANLAARQRAASETREMIGVEKQEAEIAAENTVGFSASGIQGNFIADVSSALSMDAGEKRGVISAQSLFESQSAELDAASTAQNLFNSNELLPTGSISYGGDIAGAVLGGISSGVSAIGAIGNMTKGPSTSPSTSLAARQEFTAGLGGLKIPKSTPSFSNFDNPFG